MKWFDPQYWVDGDKGYGNEQITYLYNHFKLPLDKKGFNLQKSLSEWKALKVFVREMYPHDIAALSLWKNVLCYRKAEYLNLCLIASVVLCISGSNSTVDRAFSLLTLMLSDRRLSSSHDLVEDLMLIKGNDKNWSSNERKEIIETALTSYMNKRRSKKITKARDESDHDIDEPLKKVQVLDPSVLDDYDTDTDNSSISECDVYVTDDDQELVDSMTIDSDN